MWFINTTDEDTSLNIYLKVTEIIIVVTYDEAFVLALKSIWYTSINFSYYLTNYIFNTARDTYTCCRDWFSTWTLIRLGGITIIWCKSLHSPSCRVIRLLYLFFQFSFPLNVREAIGNIILPLASARRTADLISMINVTYVGSLTAARENAIRDVII